MLEYNNKLVTIIEKELKVGSKVESNLHPISERTENDSEMISDNRSMSIRGIKHQTPSNTAKDDDHHKDQRSEVKLELIQEETSPKPDENLESDIHEEIQELIDRYNRDYISRRDEFSNAFKEIIYSLEDDKLRFAEQQERNIELLDVKTAELQELMKEVKALGSAALLAKIGEKNKKVAQDVSAILERTRRG